MWSDRISPERRKRLAASLRLPLSPSGAGSFAVLNGRSYENPLATISYSAGSALVRSARGTLTVEGRGFDILEAMLEAWRDRQGAVLAGFLSYDLADEIEDLGPAPAADFDFPKFFFGLYEGSSSAPVPASPADFAAAPLTSRPDRKQFEAAVHRIVARIHAGDFFQTNLCRCIEAPLAPGSEWELYTRLQSISPAKYQAFLRIGPGQAVMSVSPELFLKLEGGVAESRPIKGTRPRGSTPEKDQALVRELCASEKDRAELAMIVDVVRNDLGRVCAAGSVEVCRHAELMSLPTVHHLFSTVKGRLRADAGPVDLLRAAFPAASITGAPKIEAMRAARREEGQLRGPCMGAIGWISMDGRMELSVAIRTAFASGGRVRYYAGCGITAESDPGNEFEESRHKAAVFARAVGSQDNGNG